MHSKQADFGTIYRHERSTVTVSGKHNRNVKVALNSNQVKSLQPGVHADGGGLYLVGARAVIGCEPSVSPTLTANGRKWISPKSATVTARPPTY
jgi:hypothetical protein